MAMVSMQAVSNETRNLWAFWERGLREGQGLGGVDHAIHLADLAKTVHESVGIVCPDAVSGGNSVRRNLIRKF